MAEDSPTSALGERPAITAALTRGLCRHLIDSGFGVLAEMSLANGRRADLVGLSPTGEITIIEIKSCRADFDTDTKWPDYLPYCDRFYFGVSVEFPPDILPPDEGLIIADGFGGDIIRPAIERPLAAARRKAVTLRFARQASLALHYENG